MCIIESLKKEETWNEFLKYKVNGGHLTRQEQERLEEYSDILPPPNTCGI